MNFKKFKTVFRLIIIVVCFAYIAVFLYKNRQQLHLILNLRPRFIILLLALFMADLIINSVRIKIVIEKCSRLKLPVFGWFKIFLLGRFLNTIIPQMGNIYRCVVLKQDYNVSYTSYISSFASFAWVDTGLNLIFALITILAAGSTIRMAGLPAWQMISALIGLVIAGPVAAEFVFGLIKVKNKSLAWVHSKLSTVLTTSVNTLKDGVYFSSITVTTVVAFIIAIAEFYVCFSGLGLSVDLPALILFFAILKISDVVVITPGNLGIREIAFGILTQQIGLGITEGILVSAIMRVLSTILVFVLGIFLGGIGILRKRQDYITNKTDIMQKQ
jgi:uncharacterized protein (TIRG00374 family)